jgi:hypothetical protein
VTKFIGKTMTLTLGGTSIPCLQSVEFSEDIEEMQYQCPDSDTTLTLTGVKNITMTANILLDKGATGNTTLGAIDVNDTGAVVFHPEGPTGAGKLRYNSTLGTVTSRQTSFGINSITAVTINIRLDNLTVAITT